LFFKRLSDNYAWENEQRVKAFREQYKLGIWFGLELSNGIGSR
jgi:hypothetical protein